MWAPPGRASEVYIVMTESKRTFHRIWCRPRSCFAYDRHVGLWYSRGKKHQLSIRMKNLREIVLYFGREKNWRCNVGRSAAKSVIDAAIQRVLQSYLVLICSQLACCGARAAAFVRKRGFVLCRSSRIYKGVKRSSALT